ncbi:MAG TPA: hypothetical protein VFN57_18500 [Thermomicrobiaceae bacterium]|nr:hypothetical protein [Thermomicrobiaceae bacterium]
MTGVPRRTAALLPLLALLAALLPRVGSAQPAIQARTWVIMDASTGDLLAGQDPHLRTPMASLTKVMTALVAIQRGDLAQRVTIVPSDLVGGSSAGLQAGETDTLRTLLYGLLLPSGNDAAMAIARAVGGSPSADDPAARARFVGWMNDEAATLGLHDTHFVNPHGLDTPGHYSSAYDLALITRAAIAYPTFVQIAGSATYDGGGHHYVDLNQLPQMYPGIIAGKTGWTDGAGLCLIEVAQRNGRRLIVVLLQSTAAAWYSDATALLNEGWTLPRPATTTARAAAVFAWWQARTDGPVASGQARRGWVWGPAPLTPPTLEPYAGDPGGQRLVEYFAKGSMEINDPLAPLSSGWYVTGGRLAWEMITGKRQVGVDNYQSLPPADLPIAGDPGGDGPTYATLGPLLAAPAATAGTPVTARLAADGTVTSDPALATYGVRAGAAVGPTGHGVASVFAGYLAQQGPVVVDGATATGPLFSPSLSVTGYPITEPYWVRVPVGGQVKDVLVQVFERRVLTYTPSNPAGWQVEIGNLGQAYLTWIGQSATTATQAVEPEYAVLAGIDW